MTQLHVLGVMGWPGKGCPSLTLALPVGTHAIPSSPPSAHASPPQPPFSLPLTFPLPPTVKLSVKSLFVRGGVVRYVHLPSDAVDVELLQDASRKEAAEAAKKR